MKRVKDLKIGDLIWSTMFFGKIADLISTEVLKLEKTNDNIILINDTIEATSCRTVIFGDTDYFLNERDAYPQFIKLLEKEIEACRTAIDLSVKALEKREKYLLKLKISNALEQHK